MQEALRAKEASAASFKAQIKQLSAKGKSLKQEVRNGEKALEAAKKAHSRVVEEMDLVVAEGKRQAQEELAEKVAQIEELQSCIKRDELLISDLS